MVRVHTKIPGSSCFRISKTRIRARSPALQSNPAYNSIKSNHSNNEYYECSSSFGSDTPRLSAENPEKQGNRIMVVVDPTQEAKGALQWALSHTVQEEDTLILLHIVKPSKTGKEKGAMIVEQAKEKKANLLILGHRKRSKAWRFWMKWTGRKRSVVDYCIQNADCMTIAVRRKSRKLGGYLITTKRHKNFWLLA
ncbi:Midasin [Bienertia sinuspersici]